jgi:hypothetical protein
MRIPLTGVTSANALSSTAVRFTGALGARWIRVAALVAVYTVILSGCPQPPASPITANLQPNVITIAKIQSGGILPENCNDWTSPWLTPQDWWNSLQVGQSPKAVNQAAVGFELKFDTHGGCSKFRQDLYRAGISYDLSNSASLKGLVSRATITLSSVILPSGVSTTGLCQPMTGGGGSLLILRMLNGATLPSSVAAFAYLGSGPSATPFPDSATVFGMTFPWVPGQITTGVQTGVGVTTQASGTGGATFTVDVTSYLNGALNRGDKSLAFMLSGSDETSTAAFPPGPLDCKTSYQFGPMAIVHL